MVRHVAAFKNTFIATIAFQSVCGSVVTVIVLLYNAITDDDDDDCKQYGFVTVVVSMFFIAFHQSGQHKSINRREQEQN